MNTGRMNPQLRLLRHKCRHTVEACKRGHWTRVTILTLEILALVNRLDELKDTEHFP